SGACPDQGGCGTNGTCASGTGACQDYPATTMCSAPASCSNAMFTTFQNCNGTGMCNMNATAPAACPGNLKCMGSSCLSMCNTSNDCVSATNFTCVGGACLKSPGQACGMS